MCSVSTGEGETNAMQDVSTGWETVRETTLGSSHFRAYSLTEERLMNTGKYRAIDVKATKEVLSAVRDQRT